MSEEVGTIIEEARERGEDGIEMLKEAVRKWPREVAAHTAWARALRKAGRLEEAVRACYGAIRVRPDVVDAQVELAEMLAVQGRLPQAKKVWGDVLRLEPKKGQWWRRYGVECSRLGQGAEAAKAFTRSIELEPENKDGWYGLGGVYELAKQWGEAEEVFRRALRRFSGDKDVIMRLAGALDGQKRWQEALALLLELSKASPEDANILRDVGRIMMELRRFEEAKKIYRRAIELEGNEPVAWHQLGRIARHQGKLQESIENYGRALEIMPKLGMTRADRSFAILATGDLARGFAEYAWRVELPNFEEGKRKFEMRAWQGEEIAGKTIMLCAEQGLGDAIQFLRYVPLVAGRGAKCVVEVQEESLRRLAASVAGVSQVVVRELEGWPKCDVRCSLMNLAKIFGTTQETIPGREPYVRVDEKTREKWRGLVGARDGRKRVGLVWAGSTKHSGDAWRSITPELLKGLAAVEGVEWFNLQKGTGMAARLPGELPVVDRMGEAVDFMDTAGLIEQLDLVISVDTSVVHLAGALGKAVWVMVPARPDWRWMMEREDSPWYPSMRLIRQKEEGQWGEVVERVAGELRRWVAP